MIHINVHKLYSPKMLTSSKIFKESNFKIQNCTSGDNNFIQKFKEEIKLLPFAKEHTEK